MLHYQFVHRKISTLTFGTNLVCHEYHLTHSLTCHTCGMLHLLQVLPPTKTRLLRNTEVTGCGTLHIGHALCITVHTENGSGFFHPTVLGTKCFSHWLWNAVWCSHKGIKIRSSRLKKNCELSAHRKAMFLEASKLLECCIHLVVPIMNQNYGSAIITVQSRGRAL